MPRATKRQEDILTGLLLGDAYMNRGRFRFAMTNYEFVDWVQDELKPFSNPIRVRDGREHAEAQMKCKTNHIVNPDKVKDQFRVSVTMNDRLRSLLDWYGNGKKVYPVDDIELTPTLVKIWYCCDGFLQLGTSVDSNAIISMRAQDVEVIEAFKREFEKLGFRATVQKEEQIYIRTESMNKFMNWMGDPCPGFEYKWQWEDHGLYKAYKKKADGDDGAEKLIEERTVNYNPPTSW